MTGCLSAPTTANFFSRTMRTVHFRFFFLCGYKSDVVAGFRLFIPNGHKHLCCRDVIPLRFVNRNRSRTTCRQSATNHDRLQNGAMQPSKKQTNKKKQHHYVCNSPSPLKNPYTVPQQVLTLCRALLGRHSNKKKAGRHSSGKRAAVPSKEHLTS